jgi:hypothetical protein
MKPCPLTFFVLRLNQSKEEKCISGFLAPDHHSSPQQVWLEERYLKTVASSEWFNTAGRSVKTGLIASVIVSQVM